METTDNDLSLLPPKKFILYHTMYFKEEMPTSLRKEYFILFNVFNKVASEIYISYTPIRKLKKGQLCQQRVRF